MTRGATRSSRALRACGGGLLAALAACASGAPAAVEPVVYGSDDRLEVYEHPSATMRAVATASVAMMIDATLLDLTDPADVQIDYATTLGEDEMLCAGEPFADQPAPGDCSGTLIDARHVMTAGHCVTDGCDASLQWVLGYRYASSGTLATLSRDDVYACAGVVVYEETDTTDYAIVSLDRDVVGHAPAPIAGDVARVGDSLTLIGHPSGLPMKIASNGAVLSTEGDTFHASVDAFAGNSGSGVFDDRGAVVGILDSGETDFVPSGGCFVVNTVPSTGVEGESLTDVHVAIEAFCATGVSSPVCEPGPVDAGLPASDGAIAVDAGTSAPSSGCACHVTSARSAPQRWHGAVLAMLAIAVASVRRRARGQRSARRPVNERASRSP